MPKMLLGNALFAACVVAWFIYAGWERELMLSGTILAFACFLSGIFMGYILRGPRKVRRAAEGVTEQQVATPFSLTPDMEKSKVEPEQTSKPEAVTEPDEHQEFDLHGAIEASAAEPAEIEKTRNDSPTAIASPMLPTDMQ